MVVEPEIFPNFADARQKTAGRRSTSLRSSAKRAQHFGTAAESSTCFEVCDLPRRHVHVGAHTCAYVSIDICIYIYI